MQIAILIAVGSVITGIKINMNQSIDIAQMRRKYTRYNSKDIASTVTKELMCLIAKTTFISTLSGGCIQIT